MKILLDTHSGLWFLSGDPRLRPSKREMIQNSENIKLVSLASLWEMAIKSSIGKLTLPRVLDELLPADFQKLEISLAHIKLVEILPLHHKDPFDRMLIAQALTEDIFVMSDDPEFPAYRVKLV